MLFKRVIVWTLVESLLMVQTAGFAQSSHDQGVSAGQSANTTIRGLVTQPSANSVVPGYTTTPPEAALAGRSSLGSDINAKLAACAATPNDQTCQALRTAVNSANTPRPAVGFSDPSVAAASSVYRNPSIELGSLSAYYSGCTTAEVTTAGGITNKVCHVYPSGATYSTHRDLSVSVDLTPSCELGTWFARAQANRTGADYMVAEAQCTIRPDGRQRFQFYAAGGNGACVDWQALDLPTAVSSSATFVTDLSPHWEGYCWSPFKVVLLPGSGCTNGNCNYRFQFGEPVYACPPAYTLGSSITGTWDGATYAHGPSDRCFAQSSPAVDAGCPAGLQTLLDAAGTQLCLAPGPEPALVGASGWTVPLAFQQPTMVAVETDTWADRSVGAQTGGRCTTVGPETCVEGPSTKIIGGQSVTRACWSYASAIACGGSSSADECSVLAAQGCTPGAQTCVRVNPSTGDCDIYEARYSCPVAGETYTTANNCPSNVFCLGSNCFNTSYSGDTDFARSMSMLEAVREAGVYLDPDKMTVFNGEARFCRDRLLKNCCAADGSGGGMSNQTMFGVGSRLVFDALMSARNYDYIRQGIVAFLTSNTSWTASAGVGAYGITVEVFAGDAVVTTTGNILYSGAISESTGMVVAFNPWTLAIAVVITVIMSAMSCNSDEAVTALSEGAHLCHSLGNWCSSCIRAFGSCVSCIEQTTGKCCFNSLLARIVNEHGRIQLGKDWGGAQNPDCSGFSIAQLQSLDFARMDFTEFYASLVAKSPNLANIQNSNATKIQNCYYGQGKC